MEHVALVRERMSTKEMNVEDAVDRTLFWEADLCEDSIKLLNAQVAVLRKHFVNSLSQSIKNAEDLNKLAGWKQWNDVLEDTKK